MKSKVGTDEAVVAKIEKGNGRTAIIQNCVSGHQALNSREMAEIKEPPEVVFDFVAGFVGVIVDEFTDVIIDEIVNGFVDVFVDGFVDEFTDVIVDEIVVGIVEKFAEGFANYCGKS